MALALLRALFVLRCCSRWQERCSSALYGKSLLLVCPGVRACVPLTGLMRDFIPSDGDTVEIRLDADGKTLLIRDNHAADEGADPSAAHQEPT